MTILAENLDYTDKDFDSLRERLIALVRSVFPTWTDHNVLTFGNLLIELYAFIGDVLVFYQDAQARESRIVTATQRASVIKLARLIGFELPGASAATVDVTLSLPGGTTPGDVDFPAGTIVRTPEVDGSVRFQLLAAAQIPAGDTEVVTTVENSDNRNEILSSNDLPDQAFLLSYSPYLDGSLDGNINTSQGSWEEVDSFLNSGPTDRHFTVEVDQNDRATIRFGDGGNGLIPSGSITVDYKIGGGSAGNVDAGSISIVEGAFTDTLGNPVRVEVTNDESAGGGDERMSLGTAQVLAPASLRVLNRTVAREDYEINAIKVDGVARALMLTSDQYPAITENTGHLFVIPVGGGTPSTALKNAVEQMVTVEYPNTITFNLFVVDPQYKTIDVNATVYLRQGSNPSTVRAAILANLDAFFALTNEDGTPNQQIDFGFNYKDADGDPAGEVVWSDLFNVVRDSAGVRKIGDKFEDFLLNGNDRDVAIELQEFPILGVVTLVNGDTGLPL